MDNDQTVFFSTLEETYVRLLAGAANGEGPQGSPSYQRNAAYVALRNAAYAAKAALVQTKDRDMWIKDVDAWNERAERHLRMLKLIRL